MRLGGEVHHQVGLRDEPVDHGGVGDVALHELDVGAVQARGVARIGEGVEHGDVDVRGLSGRG